MAALPYMQLYVADYLADTAHLSVTESGAYLHLIMNYWQTGKPLINNDARLAAIAKCFNGEWPQVRDSVIEFFEERDGYLHHARIDRDLNKVGRGGDDPELAGAWKGYVYFISAGARDGYKIGYSKNPWARLKDLQTGSSKKLLLVATLKTTVVSEKALHDELSEYRTQGEWFSASPMIESLVSAVKAKKLATVDEAVAYCRNYGKTTVAATKDTDTDTDIKATPVVPSGDSDAVVSAYNDLLPNCERVSVLNPKRQKRIAAVVKLARGVCAAQGWPYEALKFWRAYFAECAKDPWMRGEVANPNNARWKQNLDVLIHEDRFAKVMDRAIESLRRAS